jgi:hypothetical protein
MEHTGIHRVVDVEWKFGGNNSVMMMIMLHHDLILGVCILLRV